MQQPTYRITKARIEDIERLVEIELAAARLLEGHAPESILAEATSREDFLTAFDRGLLWVALADNVPVGFAHVQQFESNALHLDELDVHPAHGRRGLGRQLVMTVCEWASREGYHSVTLTTFRDVPWNMPFYASLGFELVDPDAVSAELQAVVDDEIRRGLDPTKRVVMRRRCH